MEINVILRDLNKLVRILGGSGNIPESPSLTDLMTNRGRASDKCKISLDLDIGNTETRPREPGEDITYSVYEFTRPKRSFVVVRKYGDEECPHYDIYSFEVNKELKVRNLNHTGEVV